MNFSKAFLLSTLAGLTTVFGAIPIIFTNKKKTNFIILSLSFASAIMLFICFFDLIPEGFNLITNNFNKVFAILIMLLFIVIGINLSLFIEKIIPMNNKVSDTSLFKIGLFSTIAIIIHNIPEGMATFTTATSNINLGILLAFSIALHNIPEGISISLPIYYATSSKKTAFLYTLISGLSEPFGALIAYLFLAPFINDISLSILYFLTSGIMFYVSIFSLLLTSLKYKRYKITFISFSIGILFSIITKFIIS